MNKLFDLLDKYNPFIVVLKLRTNGDLFVKMPEKKSEKLILPSRKTPRFICGVAHQFRRYRNRYKR